MSRLQRQAWALGFKSLGAIALLAILWVIVAWPWTLATGNAVDHGHPKGSADYNSAGWTAELLYLAALAAVVAFGSMRARAHRRRVMATPGWRHAPTDPFGLQRWWDGAFWTDATQWDFDVARSRFGSQYFTHRGCTMRHRTRRRAALHKLCARDR